MRVIYFVSLFPCWSETFIVREIHELLKIGVDVRIVSLKPASEALVQSDARTLLGRVSYPVALSRSFPRVAAEVLGHPLLTIRELTEIVCCFARRPSALVKTLVTWWRILALLDEVRRLQPQHLHAHWATYPSTAAMTASARTGIPFSFTAHAHDIFLEDHLLARKMSRAVFSVTISEFNKHFLAERVSPLVLQRMRVIHCGVSPKDYAFKPEGRQAGLVVAVGRLDHIKGFTHLVDACRILVDRGVEFECIVVGEGPLRGELTQQIEAKGLVRNIKLVGARKQEEVRILLYSASVFVLPCVVTPQGDRDGIPVALMEAMACGVPVVSTHVSGIPELVDGGVCGLLANPGDSTDLARCIEQQIRHPEHARTMALSARRKVESEFDVTTEAGKLYAAIF